MLRPQSFQSYPESRFAHGDAKNAVSAPHAPRDNRLLAALPLKDYERLLPDLVPVPLPAGCTIHGAGERERHLYFLTAGIVTRFYVTRSGASAEFAVAGNEGVIGIASVLGGESTPSQALVLSAGHAYRLSARVLNEEFKRDTPLAELLLRYTNALMTQTMQSAACNRHHMVEQQLCRWILSCLDRLPSNELAMTQEMIAEMLGVRREGVTDAAGKLQNAGLIRTGRGHVAVLDRAGLEARSCECYAVVRREYDRLLPPQVADAPPRAPKLALVAGDQAPA